jgi:hypothetical protein
MYLLSFIILPFKSYKAWYQYFNHDRFTKYIRHLTQIILWWHGFLVWKRNENSPFWLCWCVSQPLRDVEKKRQITWSALARGSTLRKYYTAATILLITIRNITVVLYNWQIMALGPYSRNKCARWYLAYIIQRVALSILRRRHVTILLFTDLT